jgi:hypothetical protein
VAIRGGTASSLYLNPGFIGSRVNVKVTVSKAGYASRAASTKLVTVGKAVITPERQHRASPGATSLGATLTANVGTYSPAPSAYAIPVVPQWRAAISGARYRTYRILPQITEVSISVRVWASLTYYGHPAAR